MTSISKQTLSHTQTHAHARSGVMTTVAVIFSMRVMSISKSWQGGKMTWLAIGGCPTFGHLHKYSSKLRTTAKTMCWWVKRNFHKNQAWASSDKKGKASSGDQVDIVAQRLCHLLTFMLIVLNVNQRGGSQSEEMPVVPFPGDIGSQSLGCPQKR